MGGVASCDAPPVLGVVANCDSDRRCCSSSCSTAERRHCSRTDDVDVPEIVDMSCFSKPKLTQIEARPHAVPVTGLDCISEWHCDLNDFHWEEMEPTADCSIYAAGTEDTRASTKCTNTPNASERSLANPAEESKTKDLDGVPLVAGVEVLTPELVNELVKTGTCRLIDVRGSDRAAGMITGAVHVPAFSAQIPFPARLPQLVQSYKDERLIVFFCQFCKHRAPLCANLFRQHTDAAGNNLQRVAIMEGGFRGWQRIGLPVHGEGAAADQALADGHARHEGAMATTMASLQQLQRGASQLALKVAR